MNRKKLISSLVILVSCFYGIGYSASTSTISQRGSDEHDDHTEEQQQKNKDHDEMRQQADHDEEQCTEGCDEDEPTEKH